MGTKEQILALFEEQKGTYFSGEEIAERLSVSRTAVWKAVNSLRAEGYQIDAVPHKGYCLSVDTDILSAQGIGKYLNENCKGMEITVLPEASSTNTLLREKAEGGAPDGSVLLANRQTAGRGRMGRSFYSPSDTGVYLSLLLRPAGLSPAQAMRLTTIAAVAACEAIEAVADKKAAIKWVNDVYLEGKKVSGILTEASFGLENNSLEYVVLGIGFNAYPPEGGFPEELAEIAGSIFEKRQNDGKNHLAAAFLNRFMAYYTAAETEEYVEKYRARSFVIGKEIRVLSREGGKRARALDVDHDCRLLVEYPDGTREALSSGEISVRLAE